MNPLKIGQVNFRLTLIEIKGPLAVCKCECGKEISIRKYLFVRTKSCGCFLKDFCKDLGKKPKMYLYVPDASFNFLFSRYRTTAKKKKIEFSLTKEEFKVLTSGLCNYCGVKPTQKIKNPRRNNDLTLVPHHEYVFNGVDRVCPSVGYRIDNCVSCCKTCNYAKNTLTLNEFREWIDRLIEYQKGIKND